jgi:hypothetical protein
VAGDAFLAPIWERLQTKAAVFMFGHIAPSVIEQVPRLDSVIVNFIKFKGLEVCYLD